MIERHTKLLEQVNDNKRIEVAALAALLQVSQVTIRKDLDALERQGLLKREHGFAVMTASDDMKHHLAFHYETKRAIAVAAARMVVDGETVMIESGSCCALLAQALAAQRHDVTIITNSAFIAGFIRKAPYARTILLGGAYQNESQAMVGPMTRQCVSSFYVDKVFVGTDGFAERSGFTGNNLMRVEIIRAMAERAKQVIVLTESVKFARQGVVAQFTPEEVDYVFTDGGVEEKTVEFLRKRQVSVCIAPTAEQNQ